MITPTTQSYIDTTMPRLEGWTYPAKASALVQACQAIRPKLAVEIGVFGGRSLFAIALAMAECSHDNLVIGIDPWRAQHSVTGYQPDDPNAKWWSSIDHEAIYLGCVKAQKELGLGNVELYRGTSAEALPYVQGLGRLDFLHIDGNHTEASAIHDVVQYVPLVRPGGIICMDDINWASTAKAQEILANWATKNFEVAADGQACAFYTKKGPGLDKAKGQA